VNFGGEIITLEENKNRFLELCRTCIKRDGIDKLLLWVNASDFFTAPASTRFHGCAEGCLCEHSLNVYDALKQIVSTYEDETISEESIAIAALFHDLCKCNFYKKGFRNVKDEETGQWYKKEVYEVEDQYPSGHGEKSCFIVQHFMKLSWDELYAIRWHMGGFDNAVRGGDFGMNGAYEKSKLAVMLHLADMTATYLKEN